MWEYLDHLIRFDISGVILSDYNNIFLIYFCFQSNMSRPWFNETISSPFKYNTGS
jgi:hypothetical protein